MRIAPVDFNIERVNRDLGDAPAEDVIAWAVGHFGSELVASTSFGATSAVVLHLIHKAAPKMPIICIDTGYLFDETYQFADELQKSLSLNLKFYTPTVSSARQEALYGKLWEQGDEGVEEYLRINKVEPMQHALSDLKAKAWVAGVRADQTDHRASLRRVDMQDGRVKIHPILHWTTEEIDAYLKDNNLPYHPLYSQGYRSIGDHHSTLPTTADMNPRDGRILGKKQECGLHLPLTDDQNKSLKSSGL